MNINSAVVSGGVALAVSLDLYRVLPDLISAGCLLFQPSIDLLVGLLVGAPPTCSLQLSESPKPPIQSLEVFFGGRGQVSDQ
ncbi:hypothetical protein DY000_02049462 [Brassica cretica]|uniref:Uncharacterized protein n=1 Tax=Brassica cretica TaxID=69181 RepID=A0ABQ7EMJ3_BRACR|nr:hypothetical protein DY000_02049462 [Brassica cretica]